jgi:hypothetical protein
MRLLPVILLLGSLFGDRLLACEPDQPLQYRLQLISTEVGGPDTVRRISVGANGCLHVHYPRFDVRAGGWSMLLSESTLIELDRLVSAAVQMPFDASALAMRKRAIDGQLQRGELADDRSELSYVAGASRHVLEIAPDTDRARKLAWTALAHDADRYPELAQLAAMWAAVEALMRLSEDPQLQRRPVTTR